MILEIALLVGAIYFLYTWLKPTSAPPGPWGLPLFGYLPFLGRKMNVSLTQLSKKYGDVYSLSIGTRKMVIICGNEAIKEALAPGKADFSGRPDFFTYRLADTAYGFADYTPRFIALKRIGVKAIGMFSNVRNEALEEVAQKAAEDFIEECKKHKNKAFNPKEQLYPIVCGIMGFICYGKQWRGTDEELRKILSTADEVGKTVVAGILVDYIPSLKFLMKGQIERYKRVMGNIRGYSATLVEKVLNEFKPGRPLTVADALQKSANEMTQEEKDSLKISDRYIVGMIGNLFGAGFGTISITIRWALMLLAKNTDCQNKLFEELDTVIGKGRPISFGDSKNLPYLNAVITEVYRYSSIASVAITHSTTTDTWFRGFFIRAKTPVIVNIYSAHHDERIFPEPKKFRPERFIRDDGSFDSSLAEHVFPYGLGHRRCGGEALAKLEIYLFLATIFHRCKVEEVPESPLDPVNGYAFTFGLDPNPFTVAFKSRYNEW